MEISLQFGRERIPTYIFHAAQARDGKSVAFYSYENVSRESFPDRIKASNVLIPLDLQMEISLQFGRERIPDLQT